MLLKPLYLLIIFTTAGSSGSHLETNKSTASKKLIFYTTSLYERRNFPSNKALVKQLYDARTEVRNPEMISNFIKKLNQHYGLYKSQQDTITDTRIYIELLNGKKPELEIEIFAGGQILLINKERYFTSKEFYEFLSAYIPLKYSGLKELK
ncbi:MAG: hypothetical protein SFU21_13890 [Flavihumibacter sp.]|nr:hypothetical protein [Flavihumibacter sp.]